MKKSIMKIFNKTFFFTSIDLDAFENVCRPNNGTSECVRPEEGSSSQKYLYLFMLANALHGAGSTPMFTLGTSFIDENSKAEQTPFFLGNMLSTFFLDFKAANIPNVCIGNNCGSPNNRTLICVYWAILC